MRSKNNVEDQRKLEEDLKKLEGIAHSQGNVLNLSFLFITIKMDVNEVQEYIDYFEARGISVTNDDVEPDSTEENIDISDSDIKPFDPSKIDITMVKMTIDSIIKRIEYEELEFDSDFQRKYGLWSPVQKSQLIESILLRIPLPAFYFDASNDDKWLIIDGLQRMSALKEFIVEKNLKLQGMEFLKELNNKRFEDLPRSLQRRIEETNVNAYLINPATPANVKFNIFKRINTGGLVLTSQEIRNALYQGEATKFIKKLSMNKDFLAVTDNSIKSDRMLDREFCLRFVAFTQLELSQYNGYIDEFLNMGMEYLNKRKPDELIAIEKKFKECMKVCNTIFGKYAFRKMGSDGRKRPINKAVFETWCYVISELNDSDVQRLISKREMVKKEFIKLCDEYSFMNYLKASDKGSVLGRIRKLVNMIEKVVGDSD